MTDQSALQPPHLPLLPATHVIGFEAERRSGADKTPAGNRKLPVRSTAASSADAHDARGEQAAIGSVDDDGVYTVDVPGAGR